MSETWSTPKSQEVHIWGIHLDGFVISLCCAFRGPGTPHPLNHQDHPQNLGFARIKMNILAKSYPYSKADHIPCENSSGNLGKNDWPLMVKIKFCDPCQARLFSCHVLSCPRARVQPAVRTCESMVSQIIFLDRICRRVFFINRSGRSGHWGEGLKANRELGQVWKITLPLEPKWQ